MAIKLETPGEVFDHVHITDFHFRRPARQGAGGSVRIRYRMCTGAYPVAFSPDPEKELWIADLAQTIGARAAAGDFDMLNSWTAIQRVIAALIRASHGIPVVFSEVD